MPTMKRFDFTKENKKTGVMDKVGHLDFEGKEGEEKCKLYFYGDIVSETWESEWYEDAKCPQDIADFLNQIDGFENIEIYFNSGGGNVFAGLAIYNQLRRHEGHKTGYVDSLAASIASVIMLACDELHFMSGAQCMIHKPLCIACGNANDFEKTIEHLNKCEESIVDIYMENVKEGVTREQIQLLMENETWMSGRETAQYFNVEIEEQPAAAACTSDYFNKYKNIPEHLKKVENKEAVNIEEIANAVLKVLSEREKAETEKAKEDEINDLLEDLDEYGI